MMTIVAFQSVPRTVFMALALHQTSASVSQDMGVRYAIIVSIRFCYLSNIFLKIIEILKPDIFRKYFHLVFYSWYSIQFSLPRN